MSRGKLFICLIFIVSTFLIAVAHAQEVASLSITCRAGYFFQYLANGIPASGYNASPYLPGGMSGIGIVDTQKIWAHAHDSYKGSDEDTALLAQATLDSAADLYGKDSTI